MNAGFGSLTTLKSHVLAGDLATTVDYDAAVSLVGLGVVGQFERHCNRQFARTAGATYTTGADCVAFALPRYPVEVLTQIEFRSTPSDAWVVQTLSGLLSSFDEASGVAVLWSALGDRNGQVRFTYTGGYWWDTTEDDSGTLPSGATALPDDLRLAWVLQSQHIWSRRDNLGIAVTQKPDERSKLSDLELVPQVKSILTAYIRHG